nr:P1 protein [Oat mosaic virus]
MSSSRNLALLATMENQVPEWAQRIVRSSRNENQEMPRPISDTWKKIITANMLPPGNPTTTISDKDGSVVAHFGAYDSYLSTILQALGTPLQRLRMHTKPTPQEAALFEDCSDKPWFFTKNDYHAWAFQYETVVQTFVTFTFRDGFCYLNLFTPMSFAVTIDHTESFCRILEQIPEALGAFPTLGNILKVLIMLSHKFPEVVNAAHPTIAKHPGEPHLHVVDRRGVPPSWLLLCSSTIGNLITLLLNNIDNEALSFPTG